MTGMTKDERLLYEINNRTPAQVVKYVNRLTRQAVLAERAACSSYLNSLLKHEIGLPKLTINKILAWLRINRAAADQYQKLEDKEPLDRTTGNI